MDNVLDNLESIVIKKITRNQETDAISINNSFDDTVTKEHILELNINNSVIRNIVCTNSNVKNLIYGHLYTQNYISSLADVESFNISNDNKSAKITLKDFDIKKVKRINNTDITTTGFVYSENAISDPKIQNPLNDKFIEENVLKIMKNSEYILSANEIFNKTACVHSAALAFNNEIKYYEVDLGRHNAVDKVIGAALINGDKIEDSILYVTGRIPCDMISKVATAGIKMVVTRAAVTYNAIQIAKNHNIRLVGFSRGKSINIYN